MVEFIQALITGGVVGSLLALLAFGIVLTYRTTGIFNFAQGALGMLFAFLFFQLIDGGRVFLLVAVWEGAPTVPVWVALPLVVLIIAPALGWLLDRILFRHLRGAETHIQIVSTIGLLIAVQGLVAMVWTGTPDISPHDIFPAANLRVGSFTTPLSNFWTMAIAVGLALGLVVFLRSTRTGVRMRAVVDRPELAELVGVDSARVSALSWALSTSFAALAGILVAPVVSASFDLNTLTLLVIPATAAAVVGRLEHLLLVLAGGVAIGVGQSLSQVYGGNTVGPVLQATLPFLVLFGALLLPIDWREVRTEVVQRTAAAREVAVSRRWRIGAAVGLAVVLILPSDVRLGWPAALDWPPLSWIPAATNGVLGWFGQFQPQFARVPGVAVAFLGLVVLVGFAGQVSLAHASLAAVGAITAAHFVADLGFPFLLSALIGGLVAVIPGVILAWRAVRLSPLFLGLATLAFAALMTQLMFNVGPLTDGTRGVRFARTAVLAHPYHYYLAGMGVFLLGALMVRNVRRGSIGLALQAMRDSEVAIRGAGASTVRLKVAVFSLAAFLAGVGGALFAGSGELVEPTAYIELFSLLFLALAVIGGIRYTRGALIGAGLLVLAREMLPVVTDWLSRQLGAVSFHNIDQLPNLLFGVGAIGLATNPGGVVEQSRDGWERFVERLARLRARWRPPAEAPGPTPAVAATATTAAAGAAAAVSVAPVSGAGAEAVTATPPVSEAGAEAVTPPETTARTPTAAASGEAPTAPIPLPSGPSAVAGAGGGVVTFPGATWFHRVGCLLTRGKQPLPVEGDRQPCPLCDPPPVAVPSPADRRAAPGRSARRGRAADDLPARSRAELYRLATELGIPGRSRMTKQELIRAIRRAQRA